jgi:hypothetical protein
MEGIIIVSLFHSSFCFNLSHIEIKRRRIMDKVKYHRIKIVILSLFFYLTNVSYGQSLIIDHNCTLLNNIPFEWIDSAKSKLHIAYQHTSHGSQLVSGLEGLFDWKGDQFAFNNGGSNNALDLHDYAMSGDLGNPDRIAWADETNQYLNNPANIDVNVIIWSWCGQVSSADSEDIQTYLELMTSLENSFPQVKFIYMTGHLDGSGVEGNLNQRNEQIRRYCRENNKILFDFADIESYNPDGNFYLDKGANDNCDYDSDNNGSQDKNWAEDWQNSHTENIDWYNCSAAHSKALNGNLKAYATWWLWASLAGWNITSDIQDNNNVNKSFMLSQNYPNPFNPSTNFEFQITDFGFVSLKVFDVLGREVATLVNEEMPAGVYKVDFSASGENAGNLSSGVYFYKLETSKFVETKKMILTK